MTKPNKRIRVGDRITIYPRGKTQTYVADFWQDGVHRRVSLKTRNGKIATQRAVKLDAELTAGVYKPPPPPTTIRQGVDDYLAFLKIENRARKTIVRYQGELFNLRDFWETQFITRLAQITHTAFDKFRTHCKEMGHAPKTMFHEAIVAKQWVKWCHRRRLMAENPLAEYKLSKPLSEPREGPSLEQLNLLLAAATGQRLVQYATLAFTGMRSGECQRLTPADVDLQTGWIKIVSRDGAETKSRRSRKVPIHARLREYLETMPTAKREWYFRAPPSNRYPDGGNWLNVKLLNSDFMALLTKLKLPAGRASRGFTIHSLRHFTETFCVNSGIPQRVIDTWLGHRSDQSMAAVYYRLSDADSQSFMAKVPFGFGEAAAELGQKTA